MIIILIIALVLTILGLTLSKNQNRKNWLYGILVFLIIWISIFGIGYYTTFYGISEYDYYYTIGVETDNNTNYTILLPIPDEKLMDQLSYPGVSFQIEDTAYGRALNISSNQNFTIYIWVDDADSTSLSLESDEVYRHFVYLNTDGNDSINLDFQLIPRRYGEDFDTIVFNGELEEGWHEYIFRSVWA
ncbi:MAG: hypothetical protein KAS32_30775 [Candidatus Peribacteraceae bacterium]|nr:hypothetical protein [Candidatus Peribacteraceae bacterium]